MQLICEKLEIDDCDSDVFNKAYEDYEKFILKNLNFAQVEEHTMPWTFRNSFGFVLAIFFTTGKIQHPLKHFKQNSILAFYKSTSRVSIPIIFR